MKTVEVDIEVTGKHLNKLPSLGTMFVDSLVKAALNNPETREHLRKVKQ